MKRPENKSSLWHKILNKTKNVASNIAILTIWNGIIVGLLFGCDRLVYKPLATQRITINGENVEYIPGGFARPNDFLTINHSDGSSVRYVGYNFDSPCPRVRHLVQNYDDLAGKTIEVKLEDSKDDIAKVRESAQETVRYYYEQVYCKNRQ